MLCAQSNVKKDDKPLLRTAPYAVIKNNIELGNPLVSYKVM